MEFVTNSSTSAPERWENSKKNNKKMESSRKVQIQPLIGIGNIWCDIIRMQSNICRRWKEKGEIIICNAKHLEEIHEVDTMSYQKIWDDIRGFYLAKLKKVKELKGFGRLKRRDFGDR